jgi:hypothetical protein
VETMRREMERKKMLPEKLESPWFDGTRQWKRLKDKRKEKEIGTKEVKKSLTGKTSAT